MDLRAWQGTDDEASMGKHKNDKIACENTSTQRNHIDLEF